mmetsp:Transcript_50059/g.131952  ORF Transcript_50059/g.131952 Transcript_50059/m.131952 type:complete len:109 (-) Transcript_50059:45-371(-)
MTSPASPDHHVVSAAVELGVAHNVVIRGGAVWVALRQLSNAQSVDVTAMQVAALEVLGLFIVPTRVDFEGLTSASAEKLLRSVRLEDQVWVALQQEVVARLGCGHEEL